MGQCFSWILAFQYSFSLEYCVPWLLLSLIFQYCIVKLGDNLANSNHLYSVVEKAIKSKNVEGMQSSDHPEGGHFLTFLRLVNSDG